MITRTQSSLVMTAEHGDEGRTVEYRLVGRGKDVRGYRMSADDMRTLYKDEKPVILVRFHGYEEWLIEARVLSFHEGVRYLDDVCKRIEARVAANPPVPTEADRKWLTKILAQARARKVEIK